MTATFHALAMLALSGATVAACFGLRKPENGYRLRMGLGVAALGAAAVFMAPGHLCDAGNPILQGALGVGCTTALAVCVRNPIVAHALCLSVVVVTIGLWTNYETLVHSEGLIGNPSPHVVRLQESQLTRARSKLAEQGKADLQAYPAGWLADEAFVKQAAPAQGWSELRSVIPRYEITPLWHTWFTMIFEKRTTPVGLWFPGGTIAEGAGLLEWRERGP